MVRHGGRPARRAVENGLKARKLSLPVGRHHGTVEGVIVAACKIKAHKIKANVESAGGRFQHPKTLGHHLFPNTIARKDRDSMFTHSKPPFLKLVETTIMKVVA